MAYSGLQRSWWEEITLTRRRMIFFYDVAWIAALLVAAVFLLQANNCTDAQSGNGCVVALLKTYCKLWIKYKVFFNCMWMGAMGGLTISLKGIYDHGNASDPWKNDYNLWHIG